MALVVATSVHAGFQVVVTFLVYPAFRDVPLDHWATYHSDHSRRITGIVVLVYAGLVVASAWVMAAGPRNVGTVPNIAALFDEHCAFANPMALGAGSSLKVLEPLAAGTTPFPVSYNRSFCEWPLGTVPAPGTGTADCRAG